MIRRKYIPGKRDLGKAWTIKKNGGTKAEICKRLKIKISQYEGNTQLFNSYYEQRSLEERRKNVSTGKACKVYKKPPVNLKNGETKLDVNTIDFDILRSYVVCGFNRETIAGLLGVSRSTLYTFINKYPEVKRIFKNGEKEVLADVLKNGLLRLCKKHKLPDTHFASYMGEITSMKTKKYIDPSISAIKYLFANKLGWSSEPKNSSTNNKGAILSMLDEIHNDDEKEEETTPHEEEGEE